MASWPWERLRGLLLEPAHVDDEAVFDVAGGDTIEGGLDLLDWRELNVGEDVVRGAEVEEVGLGDARRRGSRRYCDEGR